MRIIFLGTPDFAVPSLEAINNNFNVVAVITAPDKPSGRGLQMKASPIKEFALQHGIPVLQPLKLKDPEFLKELASFKPDLQVVVAFRMLPETVWNLPPLGTWNLHASLLPQYRGAAPINHAIINGETFTGLSTFKLVHEIDQGAVALQEKLEIGQDETAGELHNRMMVRGADLLLRTINGIRNNSIELKPQEQLKNGELKEAPKLNPEFCRINWNQPAKTVHDHIRGLSPYPGASTTLAQLTGKFPLKIYKTRIISDFPAIANPGVIHLLENRHIYVSCKTGWLEILELQLSGKKRLKISEFLPGFRNSDSDYME